MKFFFTEPLYLDKFIKTVWPKKTPIEILAEKKRNKINKDRANLESALRHDTTFHKISRLIPTHNYIEEQIYKVKGNKIFIDDFEKFSELAEEDFARTRKMFLRLNKMTSNERKQVLLKLPKFKKLEYLDLIAGKEIPEEIYKLTSLSILTIVIGNGHDVLSEKLGQLQNLEHLEVGYGPIKLPNNVGTMSKLKSITIMGNSENQPDGLNELTNLEYLSMDFKLPQNNDRLKGLKNLVFLRTNFFNSGISELNNLKSLLLVDDNLGDISNLKNLEKIHLYGTEALEIDEKLLSHKSLKAIFISDPKGKIKFQKYKPKNLMTKYFYISKRDEIEVPDYIKKIKHFSYYQPY